MDDDHVNLVSLAKVREARADQRKNASEWTPVDALIEVLTKIVDGKIAPDALVVVWREKHGPGSTSTDYRVAGPDLHTTLGLLNLAAGRIRKDSEHVVKPT